MARSSISKRRKHGARPGRLRIVAGKWRSRFVPVADLPGLRPTSERIRETLFNWLAAGIEGSRCLDLFAGSGALGFEALSRGAASVIFVEHSALAAATLRDSAALLEAAGATVIEGDALQYLGQSRGMAYDVVFLDPPFGAMAAEELCRLLADAAVLADGAKIYLERRRGQPLALLPPGWSVIRDKTAGQVSYTLLAAGIGGPTT